ncbi:MAG: proprotein convertase P-domain-containing protein [Planctomycetota bacterium]|jgi:subtilisin-like proprotein convertase family protein
MVSRSLLREVVTVFVAVVVLKPLAFAGPTYIYGLNTSLPIPVSADPCHTTGWMEDAVIHVPRHHTITDLDVKITITHSSVFDLQIYIVSPDNVSLCLNMYDFKDYFSGQNYTNTIFDDQAETSISQAAAPFTGRFKPAGDDPLSIFDGQDAFGFWRLRVYDAFASDIGRLDNVELRINNPEPATIGLLATGAFLIMLQKPKRRC